MKNEKYFVCINESYRLSTDLVRGGSMSSIFINLDYPLSLQAFPNRLNGRSGSKSSRSYVL